MRVHLRELAARQFDVVAVWQLLDRGVSIEAVRHRVHHDGWRLVHRGVYALTQAPLTRQQRWMAAGLTAPDTFLAGSSAGALYGIWAHRGRFETVVRRGQCGPKRSDGLLVRYSQTLAGDVGTYDGIPITSPERTLIDLAAHADPARPLREAKRLKLVTPYSLAVSLEKHATRRGTNRLKRLNDQYANLPYSRCRSNAEAKALEIFHDAGVEPPQVNIRVAGEEADLTWPERKRIIEIDGHQFHQIAAEDERKERAWEAAGYSVGRISSERIFDAPELLLALR